MHIYVPLFTTAQTLTVSQTTLNIYMLKNYLTEKLIKWTFEQPYLL